MHSAVQVQVPCLHCINTNSLRFTQSDNIRHHVECDPQGSCAHLTGCGRRPLGRPLQRTSMQQAPPCLRSRCLVPEMQKADHPQHRPAPPMVYFAHAPQVLDAQKAYLDSEATIGGYEATVEHADALRRPYEGLAALLTCETDEIAIVQSATTAWQQAFFGLQFRAGDRILTSVHEYATNFINFLQACKRYGARIEVVPETDDGDIDVAELERMIGSGPKPKLVAVSHIATNSGRVYNAAAVGKLTRRHGIPYLLDACQSVGQLPLDVRQLGCDWLSGTSRKYLRGPRGIGFLYASRDIMSRTEPAMLDMWGGEWTAREAYEPQPMARRYEQYEVAFAAKVGLGVAVQQLLDLGQPAVWERIQQLAARLRQGLAAAPGVTVRDRGRLLCGIVSWTKEHVEPEAVKKQLREQHSIHVWVSPLSSTRVDMEARGLQACVRSSVHCYNTEEEVDRLIAAAHKL